MRVCVPACVRVLVCVCACVLVCACVKRTLFKYSGKPMFVLKSVLNLYNSVLGRVPSDGRQPTATTNTETITTDS